MMKLSGWISDHWRLGNRFRIPVVVALVLLLTVLFFPFQTTTVPAWKVRVVDDAGAPVREIKVTEHWQHYVLESVGHEELQTTNDDGLASFGVRTIRAGLARRLFARVATLDFKARTEPYGALVVWGSKAHATTVAVYQGEEVPPAEVRVQRVP
ncbi:MAG TPA: hypothetical protein VGN90_10800 [Pyrinomonadaceae bacterium]|nr:hypothetical protein [Pyrinomonadaceae bacterium]